MSINHTTILFNEEFKEIIKELKTQPELEMMKNCVEVETLHACQGVIRNYINEKYPTLIKNKMPDFFAIFICLIINMDNYHSWEEITDTFLEINRSRDIEHGMNDHYNCSCGHYIMAKNSFIITHYDTEINLLLGCECIEKSEIVNNFKEIKKTRQALVRKIETEQKKKEIKRLQEEVEKERLDSIRAENEELEIIRAEKRAKAKIAKEQHFKECPLQCVYCEKHVKKTYRDNLCGDCFGEIYTKSILNVHVKIG